MNFNLLINRKKTFAVINIALLFLIALVALLWARDVVRYLSTPKGDKSPQKSGASYKSKSTVFNDLEVLVKKNPFSSTPGDFKLIQSSDAPAAAVSDYKLVGTISGADDYSYAIFANKDGVQEAVRQGSEVGGLGRLVRVEKTKVIVNNKGQEQEIALADIVRIEEPAQQTVQPHSRRAGDFARQTGDKSFAVDQKKIQQAIDNPNQLMTDARLLPNVVDGVQKGFVMREVRNGGIYQSLGLKDGDVLLRINEYNISNPESGLQAFTALKGLERVNLDIIRNGVNMTLTYHIK